MVGTSGVIGAECAIGVVLMVAGSFVTAVSIDAVMAVGFKAVVRVTGFGGSDFRPYSVTIAAFRTTRGVGLVGMITTEGQD